MRSSRERWPLMRGRRVHDRAASWRGLACLAAAAAVGTATRDAGAQSDVAAASRPPAAVPAIWSSVAPLEVTLTLDFATLRRDRGEEAPWRDATWTYAGSGGASGAAPRTVPLRVRTRGKWRLRNCEFPPLRLDLSAAATRGTVLEGLRRPKLVSYCRNADLYEQYVIQELQLYRVQALVTRHHHFVRPLRVRYVDSRGGRTIATRVAFLLEEPDAMAKRLGARHVEHPGATSEHLDPAASAALGVFQYMIGNTDWSIAALHNVELLAADLTHYPVAYDFDHSGAVNASYALPDPKLPIRHVRDRLYRGYCVPEGVFARTFDIFAASRAEIDALYGEGDEIGRLLEPYVRKRTLEYFDAFYRTIGDPRAAKRDIVDRCLGR